MSSPTSYTDSPRRIANAASRKSATKKHQEFLDQLFGSRDWLAGHRIDDITYESLLLLRKIVSTLQGDGKDIHAECSANGRLRKTKYTRPALEALLINISADAPVSNVCFLSLLPGFMHVVQEFSPSSVPLTLPSCFSSCRQHPHCPKR